MLRRNVKYKMRIARHIVASILGKSGGRFAKR
jgi:hypothetical protein